jgi:hypothetical protein
MKIRLLAIQVTYILLFLLVACTPGNISTPVPILVESTSLPVGTPAGQSPPTSTPLVTPNLSVTLAPFDADPQQAALLQFILTELAGTEKQHLLVAQVKPTPNDVRSPLNLGSENAVLRAWIYRDNKLSDCLPKFYTESYIQESNGPWKYAYMAFSLNQVSPDFSAATVRIDRIPGLVGGKGELFDLAREGKQWKVKGQRITWTQ